MNNRSNMLLDTKTATPIVRSSNYMRTSMDFDQNIPDIQYEKNEGSLSPTQFDMERRLGPIYNQINVLTSESDEERYERKYSQYIDLYIAQPK